MQQRSATSQVFETESSMAALAPVRCSYGPTRRTPRNCTVRPGTCWPVAEESSSLQTTIWSPGLAVQKTNRQRRGSTSRIYSQPVLSSTRANAKCVAILLTRYPAFETAVQAIEDEMDDYFVKPCWHRPSGEACYSAKWPLGLVGTGSAPGPPGVPGP